MIALRADPGLRWTRGVPRLRGRAGWMALAGALAASAGLHAAVMIALAGRGDAPPPRPPVIEIASASDIAPFPSAGAGLVAPPRPVAAPVPAALGAGLPVPGPLPSPPGSGAIRDAASPGSSLLAQARIAPPAIEAPTIQPPHIAPPTIAPPTARPPADPGVPPPPPAVRVPTAPSPAVVPPATAPRPPAAVPPSPPPDGPAQSAPPDAPRRPAPARPQDRRPAAAAPAGDMVASLASSGPAMPSDGRDASAIGAAIRGGDTEAQPLPENPSPLYPVAARRAQREGRALLRVVVATDGASREVRLAESSGTPVLDAAALEAVRAWRFLPARRNGATVEDVVLVPVVFRLQP